MFQITGIIIMSILAADIFYLDESFAPILLTQKARGLRIKGNWTLHSKHEESDFHLKELAQKFLFRPFAMFVEPICFLMCLYASFVFGIIYM